MLLKRLDLTKPNMRYYKQQVQNQYEKGETTWLPMLTDT